MTRGRSAASRRWAIIATGAVALSLAGLAIVSAAQLNITGTGVALASETRCTNGPIATTPETLVTGTTYAAVSLAALTGCDGLSVQVTVYDTSGNSMVTGLTTAGADPLVVTTSGSYDAANVMGVALLVGTWGVPTTWTGPPVEIAPVTCTSLNKNGHTTGQACDVIATWSVVAYNPWPTVSAIGISYAVTTSSKYWQVEIDFSNTTTGFPGWTPTFVGSNGNPISGTCAGPLFVGVPNYAWGTGAKTGYVVGRNDGGSYGTQLCP